MDAVEFFAVVVQVTVEPVDKDFLDFGFEVCGV
jgi:hypothetical protein